jgi:signal transduction histidine kinase
VFGSLTIIGYFHVKHLALPERDQSRVISQIGYVHQGLLLATETNAPQTDIKSRSIDYLNHLNLLRDDPSFAEFHERAPKNLLSYLYASAATTDNLTNSATTPEGHQALREKLRLDAQEVHEATDKLALLEYNITQETLASHANDLMLYVIGLGILTLLVTSAGGILMVLNRRNMMLDAAKANAESIARTKAEFLANVSHEVRTPLNGIIATLQTIEDSNLAGGNKEAIDIVRKSSRSLLAIVNDVLDLSKLEAGELKISLQSFNTRTFIADILAHHSALADGKRIDLLVDLDDSVRQELTSDRLKLEQILNNLLTNALKFTEVGSVTLKVRELGGIAISSPDTRGIEFTVTDTGIGMSEEDLSELFKPYRQLDGSQVSQSKGTGLGLSIAWAMAHRLGGTISVHSRVGTGTSFKLWIPLVYSTEPEMSKCSGHEAEPDAPEVILFGNQATVFRASLALAENQARVQWIASEEKAKHIVLSLPVSVRAIVADRRFGGDAVRWFAVNAKQDGLCSRTPILVFQSERQFPIVSSNIPIFEIEGSFSRSSFLEALRLVAPSISINSPRAEIPPLEAIHDELGLIKNLKVLVVDDNSINRRVLLRLLGRIGFLDCESVSSATDAIELLETRKFDLVFMDVQMPDINGYMATRMIREQGHTNLKIIACSAHAFEADIKRSLDEGMDGHISKPIEVGELTALLRRVVLSS